MQMPIVLDGKILALKMEKEMRERVLTLKEKGCNPALATIVVGNNPASQMYVKMKEKACERVGIICVPYKYPERIQQIVIEGKIQALNVSENIHGILLQHPVPPHLDEYALFNEISSEKDVDGVTAVSFGRMAFKRDGFRPATPYGIMKLLKDYHIDVRGFHAVVVGAGPILGKPLALMLENEGATVTLCNANTEDFIVEGLVRSAGIIVGACGVAGLIKAEWLTWNPIMIDTGYENGKGDFELGSYERSSYFTPVPGGVGPMTVATLLWQTIKAAKENL